jgi:hypothetical protein
MTKYWIYNSIIIGESKKIKARANSKINLQNKIILKGNLKIKSQIHQINDLKAKIKVNFV